MQLSSIIAFFSVALAAASPLQAPGAEAVAASSVSVATVAAVGPDPGANGTAAAVGTRALAARSRYDWVQWKQSWSFDNGVPVGGESTIKLWASGSAQLKSHFHDSGFPSYDVTFSCALRDAAGRGYTFSRKGRMYGTLESGSRDFDADQTKSSADIRAHWADIENGDLKMHCNAHVAASISWDSITSWLGTILGIIKAVGPIIAIF